MTSRKKKFKPDYEVLGVIDHFQTLIDSLRNGELEFIGLEIKIESQPYPVNKHPNVLISTPNGKRSMILDLYDSNFDMIGKLNG